MHSLHAELVNNLATEEAFFKNSSRLHDGPLATGNMVLSLVVLFFVVAMSCLVIYRTIGLLGSEIRRSPVEVGSESPIIYDGFYDHPRWLGMGFLNHQQ